MTSSLWRRGTLLAVLAAGSGMVWGRAQGQEATRWREVSAANIGGWQPVRFWCDTPGRVLALGTPAQVPGTATLAQWVGGQRGTAVYTVGRDEPGAGQVYTPLTPAGERPAVSPPYFVHSSNIENVSDPAYRMTHVNEFRVPAGSFRCRYVPQAAVLAATAKHSVTVWEAGGRLSYASRNRDGTPGVFLTGGTHTLSAQNLDRYVWTRGAYRYELEVGNPDRTARPGGSLTVLGGGRVLARWPLLAYTLSVPR